MSCQSGMVRGGSSGLQPLRATVPFQLHNKTQPRIRDAKKAEKARSRPPKPSIRRTLSLETVAGPYLQGRWPKEADGQERCCVNDKATQTPSAWSEEFRGRRGSGGHKRSASWGSAEHQREISNLKQQLQKRSRQGNPGDSERDCRRQRSPGGHTPGATQTMPLVPLSRLTPRLRHSVEGLNLELEGVFVCETAEEQRAILDVPDGHRAPVPPQRCSSGSQSDPSPAPLDPALLSPPPSPPPTAGSVCETLRPFPSSPLVNSGSALLQLSPSPRPNKTYSFQREPPEGCEEALSPCLGQSLLLSSCPDPNKVNFTPHGGSAFCPVSLLKPLLPSVDFLFRSLSVSPVTGCSGQGGSPCPPPEPGAAAHQPESAFSTM